MKQKRKTKRKTIKNVKKRGRGQNERKNTKNALHIFSKENDISTGGADQTEAIKPKGEEEVNHRRKRRKIEKG